MNKNSKLIVLIAVIAIGAIVLVYNLLGSGSENANNTASNNNTSTSNTQQEQQPPAAQDNSKELTELEAQVKNDPIDAKYSDTYMRIAQIYFDQGMNNRFTGNLADSKGPMEKAIKNFELAYKSKDAADAHAGVGAAIYNIQMVAGYFGGQDQKQIAAAEDEFKKALKLDAKNQQALYWYTKYALQLKGDAKLAEQNLKVLKTTKLDATLTEEVKGLESKIKEGNTSSHSNTGTGAVTPNAGGQLPAGHPSTDGTTNK